METTFDKFINKDKTEKELFNKEYNDFLLSEFLLEKMEENSISINKMAEKTGVSVFEIQKIRSKNAEKISYRTFSNLLGALGYRLCIEKI